MHVRLDTPPLNNGDLRWRGVALDEFTGRVWKKSIEGRRSEQKNNERGFYGLNPGDELQHRLTTQTIFLEALDSPVIFAAPRAMAIQGPFPYLRVDAEGSLQWRRHDFERVIYRALSDTMLPDAETLRRDRRPYTAAFARYLQLPGTLDPRVTDLARAMIMQAQAHNRYDAARAIESQLQSYYRYSLDLKASGPDPLADFLFNVGEGHCEYFATAMAVMLRTQGVASRVVNGFLSGEYNPAAGAYTVRQSDAHSWVEVYFPETGSWVTFDPTPPAGRAEPERYGLVGVLGQYAEAFQLIWFQYVVGYDRQEQRALATGLSNRLLESRRSVWSRVSSWPTATRSFLGHSPLLGVSAAILVLVILAGRRPWRRKRRQAQAQVGPGAAPAATIDFYRRLIEALERRGITRAASQTPLEFAAASGLPAAARITEVYNRVRYGGARLSPREQSQIAAWLDRLEQESR